MAQTRNWKILAQCLLLRREYRKKILFIVLRFLIFFYYLKANPTSLFYHPEPRRLFTGLENGNILVFYNFFSLLLTTISFWSFLKIFPV